MDEDDLILKTSIGLGISMMKGSRFSATYVAPPIPVWSEPEKQASSLKGFQSSLKDKQDLNWKF